MTAQGVHPEALAEVDRDISITCMRVAAASYTRIACMRAAASHAAAAAAQHRAAGHQGAQA